MIGVAQPCSVEIDVNRNTDKIPQIKKWISDNVDLTPKGIIKRFADNILPIFAFCSSEGHFGFNNNELLIERKWENLDLVDSLKQFV
jgi:S-adenosylmethionine synthetase